MANDLKERVSKSWNRRKFVQDVGTYAKVAEAAAQDGNREKFLDACLEINGIIGHEWMITMVGQYAKCGYRLNDITCFGPCLDKLCREKKWGNSVREMINNHLST
jgi:hypothetical protein